MNSRQEYWGRDKLYEIVVKYGIEILFDPDFLLYCCMCGLDPLESGSLQDFAKRLKAFLL